MRYVRVTTTILAFLFFTAAAALACEQAGANTHVGTVVAVDTAKGVLTITDAETREDLTFVAAAELLRGVAPRDRVAVVYAKDGERLRATAVRKVAG